MSSRVIRESSPVTGGTIHECRGYIQGWANGEPIPEQSAKKILGVADKILKAGSITKQSTVQ